MSEGTIYPKYNSCSKKEPLESFQRKLNLRHQELCSTNQMIFQTLNFAGHISTRLNNLN